MVRKIKQERTQHLVLSSHIFFKNLIVKFRKCNKVNIFPLKAEFHPENFIQYENRRPQVEVVIMVVIGNNLRNKTS